MRKSFTTMLACCLMTACAAFGQTKKLYLKEAGFVQGSVTESGGNYIVKTRFGSMTIPKDQVLSIEDVITPEQEYKQRLARIDAKSPEDHFMLGRWAFEKGLLETAQKELTAALNLKPDYEMAKLLLRQVEAKQAEEARKAAAEDAARSGRIVGGTEVKAEWLVTDEEIFRVRLAELQQADRVRVTFRNNVLNRFINMMQGLGDFAQPRFSRTFRGWPPVRQALYMLDNIDRDDRETKNDILIASDPRFMIQFRRRVWPIVARYCGTADCHGGAGAMGGFRVLNVAGRNPKVDYTNFLILDGFVGRGRKMIDRDHMDQSLILQYGLPPEQAEHAHPRKIPRAYSSRNVSNYRSVISWIESLKGPPHPDYGVRLRVPWAARPPAEPTTRSAETQPARAVPSD